MQEGILFHHLLDQNSPAYFMQMTLAIKGALDPEILKKSFNLLGQRHDILRTNYVYENIKKPKQVVIKEKVFDLAFHDLSSLVETRRQSFIKDYQHQDLRFFQIYQSLKKNISLSLPQTYPYSNYIAWLEKQDWEAAGTYWKKYLEGYQQKTCLPKISNTKPPEYL